MTYEETINYLKPMSIDLVIVEDEADISGEMLMKNIKQALDIAIEALEKQMPKKPLNREDKSEISYGYCPCCSNMIDNWVDIRFCGECGQAIDWEETE